MSEPQDWMPNAGDAALLRVEVVRPFDGSDGVHVMAFHGDQQIDVKLADLLPAPDPAAPTVDDVLDAAVIEACAFVSDSGGSLKMHSDDDRAWFRRCLKKRLAEMTKDRARELRAQREEKSDG